MTKRSAKRPHELALEILSKGEPVTPKELEDYVGNGPYASKHIWFLRKLGYDISINKTGRTVTNYVYNGVGTYKAPEAKPEKVKKATAPNKTEKVKKEKVVVEKKNASPGPKSGKKKVVARKKQSKQPNDLVLRESDGEVGAFAIDPDFDRVDTGDLRSLI